MKQQAATVGKKEADLIYKFREDPVLFCSKVLGDNLWQKQQEIIQAAKDSDVLVASCHGAGKSYIASRIVIHQLALYPGTQVITTAPTDRQVKKILWKEIRAGWTGAEPPLGGEPLTKSIELGDKWYALGFATSDTNSFQGFHGDRILVVVDEAAGVDEEIFTGVDGVTSGANSRKVYIGNPTSRSGTFYSEFNTANNGYKKFSISAFDTPNFIAFGIQPEDIVNGTWRDKIKQQADCIPTDAEGNELENLLQQAYPYPQLVTPGWVEKRYKDWTPDSALYQAKVLGRFPEDEEHTVVPVYVWKQAQIDPEKAPQPEDLQGDAENLGMEVQLGVDVARFGDDLSSAALQIDGVLAEVEKVAKMDTTEVAEFVFRFVRDRFSHLHNWKHIPINVDAGGVGAGVADQLRHNKNFQNVADIKFSQQAKEEDMYLNARSEMHWEVRQGLKDGRYKVAVHSEDIENQITSLRYEITSTDRIKIEPKDKVKQRLGRSPDESDAVCLAYYERPEQQGSTLLSAWQR